ncbi:hypothetical protein [Kitasatospora sp. NPDC001175]|uniref:hypothetical protein n=1 Tax=Kitasatospora sp. NPDC001175 TaxID=3157103 RepID=UPI003D078205
MRYLGRLCVRLVVGLVSSGTQALLGGYAGVVGIGVAVLTLTALVVSALRKRGRRVVPPR